MCTCNHGDHIIALCPLHTAAPALLEALEPFAKFAEAWNVQPLFGLHDEVYTIHGGTEWEGVLRLSDCRKARAAIAAAKGAA